MAEKTKKKGTKFIFGCFIFIILIIILAGGLGVFLFNWYNNAIYNSSGNEYDKVSIKVVEGASLNNLLPELKSLGLVSSEEAFRIYLRLNNISPNIKAGEYEISKNVNVPELIEILEQGVFKKAIWVTLREGLRDDQTAEILDNAFKTAGANNKFVKTEFEDIVANPSKYQFKNEIQEFLNKYKPSERSLIGFLYPDTYSFEVDSNALTVTNILIENMIKKIKEKNINIDDVKVHENFASFYDALILASFLEKESGLDDVYLISSVFHNRIQIGMALQSDASIDFIKRENNPRPSLEDQKIESPYNTYKYLGLTPTPISNPSIKSIDASLNPKDSNYFFFRHDQAGQIYFSETYQQHLNSIYNNP